MLNEKTIEIIEEIGKVPVSTIKNLGEFQSELRDAGYISYLDASTDYLIVEKEISKEPPYSKDDFAEMIHDWQADNAEEMAGLIIDEIELNEGQWQAAAHDKTTSYIITDDGTGNIIINYLGAR